MAYAAGWEDFFELRRPLVIFCCGLFLLFSSFLGHDAMGVHMWAMMIPYGMTSSSIVVAKTNS